MEYMLMPLKKLYRLIEGRSGRKEYWMFFLLNILIIAAFVGLTLLSGVGASLAEYDPNNPAGAAAMIAGIGGVLLLIVPLIIFLILAAVAGIAVGIRRLHDLNLSGWFYLLYMVLMYVPLLNILVFIGFMVVMALPGTPSANNYGEVPDTDANEGVFE